ncbi:GntR family transcriptional regulator [Paenibacillus polymyxa]|uniref:GntR family transcriptional regulator n=1 Tax=Paenibacillus TaxID=44249 RepID=UPI0013EDC135|nr:MULTISPECIES: GntR family transcriptional regulator [Paenibacillus]KAF6581804.1 GntR family transcriptional regulator [Paenibacillus sp. EKM212P]MDY8045856.1 GntR family transcriptional regulator [Paenibacillus polymyxa]
MFELDIRSRKPIYEQLMDRVKEMIVYGSLQQDEQLPSVRALSAQLTVNPNTIQKAYRELEREGYIYSVQGKGSFVTPTQQQPQQIKRDEIRAALLKQMVEAVHFGFTQQEVDGIYVEATQTKERGMSLD